MRLYLLQWKCKFFVGLHFFFAHFFLYCSRFYLPKCHWTKANRLRQCVYGTDAHAMNNRTQHWSLWIIGKYRWFWEFSFVFTRVLLLTDKWVISKLRILFINWAVINRNQYKYDTFDSSCFCFWLYAFRLFAWNVETVILSNLKEKRMVFSTRGTTALMRQFQTWNGRFEILITDSIFSLCSSILPIKLSQI